MADKLQKSDDEWKKELTAEQYRIMREHGTEIPFTGEYVHTKDKGMYTCAACDLELFPSDAKFDSGTGWPSFDSLAANDSVELIEDKTLGMSRVEVRCSRCGAHLGHVFNDGPTETGQRYCINSACLVLKKD